MYLVYDSEKAEEIRQVFLGGVIILYPYCNDSPLTIINYHRLGSVLRGSIVYNSYNSTGFFIIIIVSVQAPKKITVGILLY